MRNLILLSIALCITTAAAAQTLRQYKKAAEEAFNNQDYFAALNYLSIVQEIDSTKVDIHYKQAESARHFNAYQLAERRYRQVLNSKKAKAYPLARYWMAVMEKMLGKYDGAINDFNRFIKSNPVGQEEYVTAAQQQIEACNWAKEIIKYPDSKLVIERLGNHVNTPYSEVVSGVKDGKLYYSSLKFKLEKDQSNPPKLFTKLLYLDENDQEQMVDLGLKEKSSHSAHAAFSRDGKRMFFNICEYEKGNIIRCDLFYRDQLADSTWSETKSLPEYINGLDYTVTQPSIAYDEYLDKEVLYFVSDRLGGKGGLDIWYSTLDATGLPEIPINLEIVNSPEDEVTPFFHSGTQTLYFSSKGRKSLGGFDIYSLEKEYGQWKEITHPGYPLSTSYNDYYFSLNDFGNVGYFSSNREGSLILEKEISACCNDIFNVEFVAYPLDLIAQTFDAKTKDPLTDVEVTLYDLTGGTPKEIDNWRLPDLHKHFYKIKSGRFFKLVAEKVDFLPDSIEFNTNNSRPGEEIVKDLFLHPLELNVLTFHGETNEPLPDVTVQLTEIDQFGNRQIIDLKETLELNSYIYPLKENRRYEMICTKDGFEKETIFFEVNDWEGPPLLKKEVLLYPTEEIIQLLRLEPFPLFFDNDQPDPNTLDTTTLQSYPVTLAAYRDRLRVFKRGYSRGLTGRSKLVAENQIQSFFEDDVNKSWDNFSEFTKAIFRRLQQGRNVNIIVKAYTSPLAPSQYNWNLSKRRISSMLNYYRQYEQGEMRQYVDSGALTIELVPYGETQAPKSISDNPKDRKNSVYSVEASKERRVEILDVSSSRQG